MHPQTPIFGLLYVCNSEPDLNINDGEMICLNVPGSFPTYIHKYDGDKGLLSNTMAYSMQTVTIGYSFPVTVYNRLYTQDDMWSNYEYI